MCLTLNKLTQALHAGPPTDFLQADVSCYLPAETATLLALPQTPRAWHRPQCLRYGGPSLPISLKPELASNPKKAEQLLKDNMAVKTSTHLQPGPQPHVAGFSSLGVWGPSPGLRICRHMVVTLSGLVWLPQQYLLRPDWVTVGRCLHL